MSNDRYERIRAALAMGPTPGPWKVGDQNGHCGISISSDDALVATAYLGLITSRAAWGEEHFALPENQGSVANAALIAACDTDTIRALLAERDALRELEERKQRDEALLRQALEALSRAHQTAMEQTLRARVPECSAFAGIAQDLDFVVAALRERLAETANDLTRCPNCGGPADNGHDREVPPNPYWCSKCTES